MLIPWMPVGKGDWTLEQVHAYAALKHLPTKQQVDGGELQLVCVRIGNIWWDFILSSSCNEVVRRPRLAKFPSTILTTVPLNQSPLDIATLSALTESARATNITAASSVMAEVFILESPSPGC